MKKFDILCPHCCGVFLETNGHYRENKPANGSMFVAKQSIIDAGWTVFPLYDSTEYNDLICPSCSQVLVDSLGRILCKVPIGDIDEITPQGEARKAMDALVSEYEPELPITIKIIEKAVLVDNGRKAWAFTTTGNKTEDMARNAAGTQYATAQPRKPGKRK